jgi:tRNA-specific adenosine deaminase 1
MTAFDAVSIDSHQSQPLADLITSTSHKLFDTLPRHGKPTIRANGRHEWTILATISLVTHTYVELVPGIEIVESTRVLPIALGTGVKVLPATKLPPAGDTLHDSHAEILARRGLVRWLIEEAGRVIKGTESEDLLEWVGGRFRLKEGVETWLYISALPVRISAIAPLRTKADHVVR